MTPIYLTNHALKNHSIIQQLYKSISQIIFLLLIKGYYEDSLLDLECFDKDPRTECLAHAAAGKCGWQGAWGDWMRDNCAFTCKTCQPTNQTTSSPAAANKTTSLATPQKEGGGTVSLTIKKSQNETGSKIILAKTCKDKSVACPLFSVSNLHYQSEVSQGA